jgi:hypothetical protein
VIGFQFRDPKFLTVCWSGAIFAATVSVPKAAVNEDDGFVFWEGRRRGGQILNGDLKVIFGPRSPGRTCLRPYRGNRNSDVEAEAVAQVVEEGADAQFGRGVFPFDAGHVPTAAFFAELVEAGRSGPDWRGTCRVRAGLANTCATSEAIFG